MVMTMFENEAAIVTGAGVGIGYEIARQLAMQGAAVMLNDIDPDAAARAAAQIVAEGGRCQPVAGDVADVAFLRRMVEATVDAFGRLDMTVANAGLTHYGDFFETQPEDVDRLLGVNLRGSYFLTQASAKQMRAQGSGGRILLMASVTGIQAIRYLSAYGMTKAALRMLARNLVVELSPHKIRINAIAPGATLTQRNVDDDANYVENWSQMIPLQEIITVEDIANTALFLLSPQAKHITGQTLVVDGGWTVYSPTPSLDFVENEQVE